MVISPDVVQQALVAKLKANIALLAWMTARSVSDEIREDYWQGPDFNYPNVRVVLGIMTPHGNGTCREQDTQVQFSVDCFSEKESSLECAQLLGLVVNAVFGHQLTGTSFAPATMDCTAAYPPTRMEERVWKGSGAFQMRLHQTT